jgi:trehalose synthase
MSGVHEVHVGAWPLARFAPLVGEAAVQEAEQLAAVLRERHDGRTIWNVNSTSVGGGVAEMLPSLLGYTRSEGIDARWLVIEGTPAFFRMTKRLHHALHGSRGDGSPLDEAAHQLYEATLAHGAVELESRVRRGDVVILHDPQTAGLAPRLVADGATVIWRCHIGTEELDHPDVVAGWRFLAPYLDPVPRLVFSREAYVPAAYRARSSVIAPSIDAFAPKNVGLDPATVQAILVHAGLVEGPPPAGEQLTFARGDGTRGRVELRADVIRHGRAPAWSEPLVVQVSRWDPLKDMLGVLRGFARFVEEPTASEAHLVLAGPSLGAVADDPEGPAVFAAVEQAFRDLPEAIRDRVHLALLPTTDVEQNAVVVNALQRHAAVVVQKSLHEGFGLTVTEAMWKARPVIASAVGGIQDQIEDGVSGILLPDPADLDALAAALRRVLDEPALAARLGAAARSRVRDHFLGLRHLTQYCELILALGESPPAARPAAA